MYTKRLERTRNLVNPLRFPVHDFQLILVGGLILMLFVLLSEQIVAIQPLRLLFGLMYVLYVPGYCLTAALFPHIDDLDGIERLGLSLGLSVAVVPLLALLLDRLPWGLRFWPIVCGEFGVIAIGTLVAFGRRIATKPDQVYAPEFTWHPRLWWSALPHLEQWIYRVVVVTLVFAVVCSTWIILVPASDTYMTEFYVLGEQGLAQDYPRQAISGQELSVIIGVLNHERDTTSYRIEVWASNRWDGNQRELVQQQESPALAPGQEQRMPISWRTPTLGKDQSIEMLLFRDGFAEPYRRLQLWIDVQY